MFRSILLAAAVSADTLFAVMGCTASGIRIRKRYALLVSFVGAFFLGISLIFAGILAAWIPASVCRWGGSVLLMGMGIMQLCRDGIRALLERRRAMCLHWKGIGIVIRICLDENAADADGSKSLSFGEAAAFAAALSVDSLISGLGAGIEGAQIPVCIAAAFALGGAAVLAGCALGRRFLPKYTWIGSIFLILLAFTRGM